MTARTRAPRRQAVSVEAAPADAPPEGYRGTTLREAGSHYLCEGPPGETPAQFVGCLLAAVLADGPVGQALRRLCVEGRALSESRRRPGDYHGIVSFLAMPRHSPAIVAGKDARGDDQNRQYWPPPHRSRASTPRKRRCKL